MSPRLGYALGGTLVGAVVGLLAYGAGRPPLVAAIAAFLVALGINMMIHYRDRGR